MRVPPPLRWLLLAVGVAGVVWALAVPVWQVPDEDSHFAYAQTVGELGQRPEDNGRRTRSSEQALAQNDSGFRRSYQRAETNPEWTAAAETRWLREEVRLGEADRKDGGGSNSAQNNPPTFYLWSVLAYEVAGGTVIDRLYAMRVWSVPLLLLFALSGWLLAGELAGRDRVAQLCAGALVGLLPMVTFISASVNPDAMLLPLWGLVTWLGVRGLRRGFTPRSLAALLAAALATAAVKPLGVTLFPAIAWALLVALWRRRGGTPPSPRLVAGAVAAVTVAGAGVVVAISPGGPLRLADYLWQFYLPELSSQEHIRQLQQWPLRDTWFEGVTGAFGWLEVRFPGWVYLLLALVLLALAAIALRGLRGRRDSAVAVFLALPAVALVVGLHLIEYRYIDTEGEAFIQGRYLLPLAPAAAGAVAAGIATLRAQRQAATAGLVLGGLVLWQLGALAITAARFYA